MSESLAVIGLLVPGVLMMFGIGALVAAGAVGFPDAYAWAVAGAVAGDGLSFWLGRRFRDRIRGLWPFSRHPTGLERGLGFFDRYGGKSVVFGRFVGPVRAIIPLVAGMLGMSPRRFLAANLLSALAWAPAYLLPGMLFGASLELASEVAFRLVILLLLLAVILWTVVWTVRTAFRVLHPHASAWLQAVLGWSALHPKFGEIGRALADPSHPEARGLALFASLLTVSAGLLMLLTGVLLGGGWPSPLDHTLFEGLRSLRNPLADHFMVYASRLADTFVVVPLIVGVLLYLAAQRHWRTTAYWLAAAAFGMLSSVVLKYSLRIPRPLSGIEGLTPFAFPSTHGMRATVLYGFLAVMIARALRARWRWIPYSIAGVIMAIVSMSRVYLGVQWLSDVLASLTLGLTWIAALGVAYHRHTRVETRWRGLAVGSVAVLTLATSLQSWRAQGADIALYTPQRPTRTVLENGWWSRDWATLPSVREDTRGLDTHPLSLQYAGALQALSGRLEAEGWRRPSPLGWRDLLTLLSPSLPLRRLPLLPQVHKGRHEELALIKDLSPNRRVVIRLWRSDLRLEPGDVPLWIGNASLQERAELLWFLGYPVTDPDFPAAFRYLDAALRGAGLELRRPRADRDLLLARPPRSHHRISPAIPSAGSVGAPRPDGREPAPP
jgi:undecaprenyl-diphosphatase